MSENCQCIPYVHHKICVRQFLTLDVVRRYLAKTIGIPDIARILPTVNGI